MKLSVSFSDSCHAHPPVTERGFTLTEIMVAMAVFMLVITGILSAHLFGLRMLQYNSAKLSATAWSRVTFGKITQEIQSSSSVSVGYITNTVAEGVTNGGSFVGLLQGETQQGNALMIYPTTNTTSYILYFLNSPDQTFRRATDQPNSAEILADSVTNTLVFTAQDIYGNVLTNNMDSRLIHILLEFYQPQQFMRDPDAYRLETSVTERVLP